MSRAGGVLDVQEVCAPIFCRIDNNKSQNAGTHALLVCFLGISRMSFVLSSILLTTRENSGTKTYSYNSGISNHIWRGHISYIGKFIFLCSRYCTTGWSYRIINEDQIIIQSQAIYALFDLEAHGSEAVKIASGNVSTTELLNKISDWALPAISRLPNSAFQVYACNPLFFFAYFQYYMKFANIQHRFNHVVQYGARYYAYLVARSSASLIYDRLFSQNPFNKESGAHWAEIQSFGGGVPPGELISDLLGASATPSSLIDAVRAEVLQNLPKRLWRWRGSFS